MGCLFNFIDLGANRGDNLVKFATNNMQRTLSALTVYDPPSNFCYYAFEPNPNFKSSLNVLRNKFKHFWKDDGGLYLHFEAAVPPKWPRMMTFRLDASPNSVGSTLIRTKHVNQMRGSIRVPTIDFIKWFDTYIPSNSTNILKIDIEGAEYELLSHLIISGHACKLKGLLFEWHSHKMKGHKFPPNIEENLIWMLKQCGVTLFSLTADEAEKHIPMRL